MAKKKNPNDELRAGAYVATMPTIEHGANIIKRERVHFCMVEEQEAHTEISLDNVEELPEIPSETNTVDTADAVAKTEPAKQEETAAPERVNHTFWEDDDSDRPQLSAAEYEKFLQENGLTTSTVSPFLPPDD